MASNCDIICFNHNNGRVLNNSVFKETIIKYILNDK